MPRRFHTVAEFATPRNSCAYFGERGEWFMVAGQHRESDSLTRPNFAVTLERLAAIDPAGDGYTVERFSCSLVGWRDHLLVSPRCKPLLREAVRIDRELAAYPVLSDDHWSELEWDEASEWWGRESHSFRVAVCEACRVDPAAAALDYLPTSHDFENADAIYDYLRD